MPKLLAGMLLMLFFLTKANSQTLSVSGTVEDTTNHTAVKNAVVALLNAKDSVLYKFARTDAGGAYNFSDVKAGEYILMTTHPYFADVIFSLPVNNNKIVVPTIALISKSKLLAEVIVKTGSPIKIKGDTTVYTADSFNVRAGANVEELLKKLPGIQVDKDGKITAMGEQVKKVLVDGEEFFGDDPGIATKNLRADVVKEVQVFDKKSDQAAFTGIDDGVKDKTINLKLKDNAKKGYFGKAEAGTDFSNYYNNSAMINAFKGKRKIAAYGIMSNTGQTNLDWQDQNNYGGGMGDNMVVQDNGDVYFMGGNSDGDNYSGGRGGIPQNWNGGLHYSNKFNNGRQILNSGYKFSKVNSPSGERTYTTNFVGDSSFSSSKISSGFTSKIKQSLNLSFETNLDSSNSLKVTARGNLNHTKSNSGYDLQSLNTKALLINTNNFSTNSVTDNSSLNTTLLWKHKFKKIARTLSVSTNYSNINSSTDSYVFSNFNIFNNGVPQSADTTDQENKLDNNTRTFTSTVTYTEPLKKDVFLSFTYNYSNTRNTNERYTYEKDINGKYASRIDSLSNAFTFKQVNNKPGVSIRVVKKKYNFSVGSSVSFNLFEQNNRTTNLTRKYNFTNFFPNASFYKKLSGYGGIRINYNGSSNAPTLDQLQPVIDNTDRLYKRTGNPDLHQSFRHSINLNYNFYNVLKEKGMWAGIYGGFTQNAFVTENTLYTDGSTVYRTVNADGNFNFGLYSNYNFKWKKPNIRISFGPTANVSRNVSLLKTETSNFVLQRAVNTNTSYGLRLDVGKEKEKKYDISVSPEFSWVNATNSVNAGASASYWQLSIRSDAEISFLKKFRFKTDVDFSAKQKDPRFPAKNQFTLWNASLTRSFFKDKLEAAVSVNDILNENRGYSRSFNDYRYTESFYNTLKRFWMVTLTWNFSKNGKPAADF